MTPQGNNQTSPEYETFDNTTALISFLKKSTLSNIWVQYMILEWILHLERKFISKKQNKTVLGPLKNLSYHVTELTIGKFPGCEQ